MKIVLLSGAKASGTLPLTLPMISYELESLSPKLPAAALV